MLGTHHSPQIVTLVLMLSNTHSAHPGDVGVGTDYAFDSGADFGCAILFSFNKEVLLDKCTSWCAQDMGFYDRPSNIQALQQTNGNVHAAVERLLQ